MKTCWGKRGQGTKNPSRSRRGVSNRVGSRDYADVKTQNNLRAQDIAKIVAAYAQRETVEKYAYLAGFDEIQENDFNLNIPRYVDTFEEEVEIDIGAVQAEINGLEEELSKVKFRMVGYLEELGL